MAAGVLCICPVDSSGGWQNAVWRKEVTPRIVYSCTIEMSGSCQDAICTHCGKECWQPGWYIYAL